jgi:hypothetical protein
VFSIHSFTEAGGHPNNEDAFLVRPHPADAACLLVALADGMGGQPGGGPAARLACSATLEIAAAVPLEQLFAPHGWDGVLQQADRTVNDDKVAGYTTLIGFSIKGNEIIGASCGDSAVMTSDGSGRTQELTRNQWKNPPVGSGEAVFIPFAAKLEPPWKALAMSDGVWKYVGWEPVKKTALELSGQALVDTLQQPARGRSSGKFQDDFTLIVIQDKG